MKEITELLLSTKREGVENLLEYMEKAGFYNSPASTKYHGSVNGALAVHSFNVYECMKKLAVALLGEEWTNNHIDSIIICSLLHDLGKAGQFGKPLYVDNVLKSGNISSSQPFKTNSELIALLKFQNTFSLQRKNKELSRGITDYMERLNMTFKAKKTNYI